MTNQVGRYHCDTILGRISENVDIGRLLTSSMFGLMMGSATNKTKRIDVERVDMRVVAKGYRPFEGPVFASSRDADSFDAFMPPILLVPERENALSASTDRWGAVSLQEVSIVPTVAHPGDAVVLTAKVSGSKTQKRDQLEIFAYSPVWKVGRKLKFKEGSKGEEPTFTLEFKILKRDPTESIPLIVRITKSELDCREQATGRQVLLQVAAKPVDEEPARQRIAARNFIDKGSFEDAFAISSSLITRKPSFVPDYELHEAVLSKKRDFRALADTYDHEFADFPVTRVPALISRQIEALYQCEDFAGVIHLGDAELNRFKKKEQPNRVRAELLGYMGLAYIRSGDLKAAAALNDRSVDWELSGVTPIVTEFRNRMSIAVAEKAMLEKPNDSQTVADYGRALLDMGRWDEGVINLNKALTLDPKLSVIKRDLAWAYAHSPGAEPPSVNLDDAIAASELSLNLGAKKQRSKDFGSWLKYATLLHLKYDQLVDQKDPTAEDWLDKCVAAYRDALHVARKGANRTAGYYDYRYGYLSGSQVTITGFAYPEADAAFTILDALRTIYAKKETYLTWCNLTNALIDLGQNSLASKSLEKLKAANPTYGEIPFVEGVLALREKHIDDARAKIGQCLSSNPRHPKANWLMSQILGEDGDIPGSLQYLAAHRKFYEDLPANR